MSNGHRHASRRQQLRGVELERRAWRLYIDHRDWSTRRIAEEIRCSQSAVVRALRRAETRAIEDVDGARRVALDELRRGREIAMDAYRASLNTRKRERKKKREGGGETGAAVFEAEITTEDQPSGDVRFLAEARRCTESIARLLGLNAPTRVELNEPYRSPFAHLSDEEMRTELAKAVKEAGIDDGTPMPPKNGDLVQR